MGAEGYVRSDYSEELFWAAIAVMMCMPYVLLLLLTAAGETVRYVPYDNEMPYQVTV